MSRPLPIEIPDGVYHVTSRGLERRDIVRQDDDRRRWVELLDVVGTRRRWRLFAWALVDNHYDLFLRTPQGDLSAGMHDLNSGYATGFNRRHRRCGPLFQGRFKGILVERNYHYWELSRYIRLNPVRAGMVEGPEEYFWSSCRFYVKNSRAPEWLGWEEVLRGHGGTMPTARREYQGYLQEGLSCRPASPLAGTVAGALFGSEGFVEKMRNWLQDRLPDREAPAARELGLPIKPESVERAVCRTLGISRESLRERRKRGNEGRAAAVYLCRKLTGESIAVLGERFGGVSGQAISKTAGEVARRMEQDRRLERCVRACEAVIAGPQRS